MTPTLVASRTSLPPEGAELAWGGPASEPVALTLVASRTALAPDEFARNGLNIRSRGFTLIELLVAISVMALLAVLSWRGLDGMVRAQAQTGQRADEVLTLQAGLAQWKVDLDALTQTPSVNSLDWDGRVLRLTRRTAAAGDGLLVVAWTRRMEAQGGQWLRWQSPVLRTVAGWNEAWSQAAHWAQNPGDEEKKREVAIAPLAEWQIFYFRSNAWTNPLSSSNGSPEAATVAAAVAVGSSPVPDGVRLMLTLPPGQAISGKLTLDWVRPTLGGER